VVGAVVVATAVALAVALALGPSPPRRITLATGQPDGMYDRFGGEYRQRLGRLGLQVQTVPSNGSADNLHRLLRHEVDIAFVQSGVAPLVPDPGEQLRALAALYLEPLWVFHRLDPGTTSLAAFAGRRVSVGPPGSGTEAVARALLREHGIDAGENLRNAEARRRLETGDLDGAFFVTSYRDPLVQALLRRRDVALLGFRHDGAYARRLPGLQAVTLPQGVLDLREDLPAHDTTLLAPAAMLVGRDDLHPRAVELLLKVAHQIHAAGSLIDPPRRYPSPEGVDIALHEAAEGFRTRGESFLSRTLPYPVVRWMGILRILLVPALVWLPLVRILPEISNWRADRQLSRLYGVLRGREAEIARARAPEEIREHLAGLASLNTSAESLARRIPAHRHRDLYHWRLHIALVRDEAVRRMAELESAARWTRGAARKEAP
jgi:TRAP transporter TAXI family solute receptor